MQAIIVKYLSPTNTKGARLKVEMQGFKPVVISYPYELDTITAYNFASKVFCIRNQLNFNMLVGGEMPKGERVYVFK